MRDEWCWEVWKARVGRVMVVVVRFGCSSAKMRTLTLHVLQWLVACEAV